MSNIDPAIIDRVPIAITDPERIPVKRYFDKEFYKLEVERLWPHVWQMACRLEQIPEVGDWIEYSNVGYSIIVVRTRDGVKAFHNACRHRGVPFAGGTTVDSTHATAHGNCAKTGFVCPFHGWRWNMDGENTLVYGKHLFSERQLDPDDVNLIPCRVETALGCAFINLDDDAPSFRETIGPLVERLEAHGVDHLRAEWCYGTVLPANWKLAMEAFMEGYHVTQTHPQLHNCLPGMYDSLYEEKSGSASTAETLSAATDGGTTREAIDAQIRHFELISEGMAGQLHPKELEIARQVPIDDLPEDPAQAVPMWFGKVISEVTTKLKERGEPVPDLLQVNQTAPLQGVEYVFPHFFLLPFFSSFASYRVRPLNTRCSRSTR
jgi:carnitine monooxygenase subunit